MHRIYLSPQNLELWWTLRGLVYIENIETPLRSIISLLHIVDLLVAVGFCNDFPMHRIFLSLQTLELCSAPGCRWAPFPPPRPIIFYFNFKYHSVTVDEFGYFIYFYVVGTKVEISYVHMATFDMVQLFTKSQNLNCLIWCNGCGHIASRIENKNQCWGN